jgi:hypothetical protein
MGNPNYNRRKIQVLKLAEKLKGKLTPKDLKFNMKVSEENARQLLQYYMEQGLFTRPRRGIYRISKRGRQRLAYLQTRLNIEKVTGIPIGLNHHDDPTNSVPIWEILAKYKEQGGQLPPGFSL